MQFRNEDEAAHYGPKVAGIADALSALLEHHARLAGRDHSHAGGPYPGDCIVCNARLALAVAEGRDPSTVDLPGQAVQDRRDVKRVGRLTYTRV